MASKDIAGLILAEASKQFQDPLCTLAEIEIIERLCNGAETFAIGQEIVKVMFEGEPNHGRVVVDYNENTPKVTTIISLKRQN